MWRPRVPSARRLLTCSAWKGGTGRGLLSGHVSGGRGVSRLRRCPKVRAAASRAVKGSPRFHVARSVAISEVWRYSSVKTEPARTHGETITAGTWRAETSEAD